MAEWEHLAWEWSERHIPTCVCRKTALGEPIGFVTAPFPVGHALFGKAIPCACTRERMARRRAEQLRRLSGLGEDDFAGFTFERFSLEWAVKGVGKLSETRFQAALAEIVQECERYAHGEVAGWLILIGTFGSGKTHLAKAIATEWIGRGGEMFFATVPDLLDVLRQGYDSEQGAAAPSFEERLGWFREVPLLSLDDFGAQRNTDWAIEKLYQVLNERYEQHRATVITSNVDIRNAAVEGIDPRLASRIADMANVYLVLPTGDFRRGRRMI